VSFIVFIDKNGYLARITTKKGKSRNWWIVKAVTNGNNSFSGTLLFSRIYFSKDMIGKKVRLKCEVIEQ